MTELTWAMVIIAIFLAVVCFVLIVIVFLVIVKNKKNEEELRETNKLFKSIYDEQGKAYLALIKENIGAIHDITHTMEVVVRVNEGGKAELLAAFNQMEQRLAGWCNTLSQLVGGGTKIFNTQASGGQTVQGGSAHGEQR